MQRALHPALAFATSAVLLGAGLASPAAAAPKITTGAGCSSTWVNNPGAMDCFIQGEDETNAGAKHPHYVTCDPGGDILCCQDNDAGHQICVEAAASGHTTIAQQIRALIAGQKLLLKAQGNTKAGNGATLTIVPGKGRLSPR
jgi:hypothetical protein